MSDVDQVIQTLRGPEPPRVWSLIVTVFGDLAQDPGAAISGSLLSLLTEPVGIRPEAVRVALHRLRKDGWIDSRRVGRASDYALTARGRAHSAEATPRIYARQAPAAGAWLLVGEAAQDGDGVALGGGVRLGAAPAPGAEVLSLSVPEGTAMPDWISARVCGAEVVAQSQALSARLAEAERLLRGAAPGAVERAVMRVLIVHGWRRIVLKVPALPDHVFPPGWAGAACRARVAALLQALPRPDLGALERAAARD